MPTHARNKTHTYAIVACISATLSLTMAYKTLADVIILIEAAREVTVGADFVNYGTASSLTTEQTLSPVGFGTDGITVNDLATDSAGWSVTLASDNFAGSSYGETISYEKISIQGDSDGVIDVIGGTSNADGITTFSNFVPFSGAGSNSTPVTLISADNRIREGVYQIFPNLELTVPAFTQPDTYNNTFTVTFIVE